MEEKGHDRGQSFEPEYPRRPKIGTSSHLEHPRPDELSPGRRSIALRSHSQRRARGRNTCVAATTEIFALPITERIEEAQGPAAFTLNKPAVRIPAPPKITIRAHRKMFRLETTPILCFVEVTGRFN